MKKLLLLLTLFFANCELSSTIEPLNPHDSLQSGDVVELNLNSSVQASYKAQWLKNVADSGITAEKPYNSRYNWYVAGAYTRSVFFNDEGYLRAIPMADGAYCALLNLLSWSIPNENKYDYDKPKDYKWDTDLFIDGRTAIVVMPNYSSRLYVLHIGEDGKLYRTKQMFSTYSEWDGKTIEIDNSNYLEEVTKR